MAKKKKKSRKGFTRSRKEWEKSIATHISKFINNLKGEDILNLTAAAISAYAGYAAAKRLGGNKIQAVGAAGSGIIAYQLAKSMNLVAGASGTAYLASLGLINVWNPLVDVTTEAMKRLFPFGYEENGYHPISSIGVTGPLIFKGVFP